MRLLLALGALGVAQAALPAGEYMVPMTDGVKLHTKVFLPAELPLRPTPAVYVRSPYGEHRTELVAALFVPFGFVAVMQDMRGTHQSEGNFTVWHDAQDAVDTMQWISSQGWSNGRVYTAGASADGIAQFSEAMRAPLQLQGQFLIVAAAQAYEVILPGGGWRKQLSQHWLRDTVPHQAGRLLERVKDNEGPGPYWNALNFTGRFDLVTYPSVIWGGWYDIFQAGTLDGFEGYQHRSRSRGSHHLVMDPLGHCEAAAAAFPNNRILLPVELAVAKFQHQEKGDSGVDASLEGVLSTPAITIYVMGPVQANLTLTSDGRVRAVPMRASALPAGASTKGGAGLAPWKGDVSAADDELGNYWASFDKWPTFSPTSLYLRDDGSLADAAPGACASALGGGSCETSYVFDPEHPAKTAGGNNLFGSCGPWDQRSVEARPDVVTWTSAPMTAATALVGPVRAVLYVRSNASDTDFSAKMSDVYPDGRSHLITEGFVRMRWRHIADANKAAWSENGRSSAPSLRGPDGLGTLDNDVPTAPSLQPGRLYRVEVDMWSTALIVNAGHSIRLTVTSSNDPRFSVNPNTGQPLGASPRQPPVVAENAIAHDSAHPSALVLPVVPLSAIPKRDNVQKAATPLAAHLASKYITYTLPRNTMV